MHASNTFMMFVHSMHACSQAGSKHSSLHYHSLDYRDGLPLGDQSTATLSLQSGSQDEEALLTALHSAQRRGRV